MAANNAKQKETIMTAGATAYRLGQGVDSCPYVNKGMSARFRRYWVEGYQAERGDFDNKEPVEEAPSVSFATPKPAGAK